MMRLTGHSTHAEVGLEAGTLGQECTARKLAAGHMGKMVVGRSQVGY
jgi:hypothetical protein